MAVLRHSPFADVELCEDLDPRDKVLVHPARDLDTLVHQTIDAIPDPCDRGAWLDMDIARVESNGLIEEQLLDMYCRRRVITDIRFFKGRNNFGYLRQT